MSDTTNIDKLALTGVSDTGGSPFRVLATDVDPSGTNPSTVVGVDPATLGGGGGHTIENDSGGAGGLASMTPTKINFRGLNDTTALDTETATVASKIFNTLTNTVGDDIDLQTIVENWTGNTTWVDSELGSDSGANIGVKHRQDRPFATITKAMESSGTDPGDTIRVRSGSYPELQLFVTKSIRIFCDPGVEFAPGSSNSFFNVNTSGIEVIILGFPHTKSRYSFSVSGSNCRVFAELYHSQSAGGGLQSQMGIISGSSNIVSILSSNSILARGIDVSGNSNVVRYNETGQNSPPATPGTSTVAVIGGDNNVVEMRVSGTWKEGNDRFFNITGDSNCLGLDLGVTRVIANAGASGLGTILGTANDVFVKFDTLALVGTSFSLGWRVYNSNAANTANRLFVEGEVFDAGADVLQDIIRLSRNGSLPYTGTAYCEWEVSKTSGSFSTYGVVHIGERDTDHSTSTRQFFVKIKNSQFEIRSATTVSQFAYFWNNTTNPDSKFLKFYNTAINPAGSMNVLTGGATILQHCQVQFLEWAFNAPIPPNPPGGGLGGALFDFAGTMIVEPNTLGGW